MRQLMLLALVATAACSSSSGGGAPPANGGSSVPLMDGFDPGPAPADGTGFQVILPIVTDIQPGGDYEYCSWTNIVLDHDVWVKSSQGVQTTTGHHTIVYYTTNPQPAGLTRICNDSDMADFRFGIGAGGEGVAQKNVLPGNLAVQIPAGAQIVINHHYLNASPQAVPQAQSAVDITFADPSATNVRTSSVAFLNTGMVIPVGQHSVDVSCTVKQKFATWRFQPHMHNWGTHITVDHVTAAASKRLFDLDWDPSFAFHPPEQSEDPTQPYMLNPGDQINVHCDYNNTTSAPLTFGAEMCVAFAMTVDPDDAGDMDCDRGNWGSF